MSLLADIKRRENRWYNKGASWVGSARYHLFQKASSYLSAFRTPFTITLLTDDRRVLPKFAVRWGAIAGCIITPFFLAAFLLWLSHSNAKESDFLRSATNRANSAQIELDTIRVAVAELQGSVPAFKSAMKTIAQALGRGGKAAVGIFLAEKLEVPFDDFDSSNGLKEIDAIMELRRSMDEATELLLMGGSLVSTGCNGKLAQPMADQREPWLYNNVFWSID